VTTRGNSLAVLADWGAQHGAHGTVSGRELMTVAARATGCCSTEDRSRLAMLYLWLSQRSRGLFHRAKSR